MTMAKDTVVLGAFYSKQDAFYHFVHFIQSHLQSSNHDCYGFCDRRSSSPTVLASSKHGDETPTSKGFRRVP